MHEKGEPKKELLKARKVVKKLGLIYQGEAPSFLVLRLLLLLRFFSFLAFKASFCDDLASSRIKQKPEETSQPGIQKRKPTFPKVQKHTHFGKFRICLHTFLICILG